MAETAFWKHPPADLLAELNATKDGLRSSEAARRLQRYGNNDAATTKRTRPWRRLVRRLGNPLIIVLLLASALSAATGDLTARLAIRPYPTALVERVTLADGKAYSLRPIRPEDASGIIDLFRRLMPEDIRMRFFAPLKQLSPVMLARLTQLDYDREMALLLCDAAPTAAAPEIHGVVRLSADPDNETAEFAIIARSDLKSHGIGHFLMDRIIAYARSRGIRTVHGDVLRENALMLKFCRDLSFSLRPLPEDAEIIRATLNLFSASTQSAH
jgi:acetyltransferase